MYLQEAQGEPITQQSILQLLYHGAELTNLINRQDSTTDTILVEDSLEDDVFRFRYMVLMYLDSDISLMEKTHPATHSLTHSLTHMLKYF